MRVSGKPAGTGGTKSVSRVLGAAPEPITRSAPPSRNSASDPGADTPGYGAAVGCQGPPDAFRSRTSGSLKFWPASAAPPSGSPATAQGTPPSPSAAAAAGSVCQPEPSLTSRPAVYEAGMIPFGVLIC